MEMDNNQGTETRDVRQNIHEKQIHICRVQKPNKNNHKTLS